MRRASRREWAKRIAKWAGSGLTGAEFAAQIGVKEATLRHWKWELKRAERARAVDAAKLSFVEIAQVASVAPEPFELILRDGRSLRIPSSFDGTALRRLLEQLEGR